MLPRPLIVGVAVVAMLFVASAAAEAPRRPAQQAEPYRFCPSPVGLWVPCVDRDRAVGFTADV